MHTAEYVLYMNFLENLRQWRRNLLFR